MLGSALALMLAVALTAVGEARLPKRKHARRARPPKHPTAKPSVAYAVTVDPPQATGASRDWLLDSLPVEPAGAPRDRVGGAGRLVIGIAGMAVAGALAILGISRAISLVFDRVLR